MKKNDGFMHEPSQSYWLIPSNQPSFPALEKDRKADIVIIGGGIAGITLAYLLQQAGVESFLLEANRIAFGTTGHTTAKITSQHELIYDRLTSKVGREQAQQYAHANEAAIHEVEGIVHKHNIECDLSQQPAVVFTGLEENIGKINKEVKAAVELGIRADYIEKIPFDIPIKAGVRFPGQAQFHPRKYLLALANQIAGHGCTIHENTKVVDIEDTPNGYELKTGDGKKVRAEKVIIATHYPFINKHGLYFARLYVERSYILAIRAKSRYPGGMYINAEEPTRSLRSQPSSEGELILVGGENHKCGQSEDTLEHYRALADFSERHFEVQEIPYHWSAQDCMTLDGIPYTGHFTSDTPNLYITTGYGKWGMTNATASAMVLRDLILHGKSDWQDVYSPSRFNVAASMKNMLVENANVAANLLEGKLSPLPDSVDIKPGECKIIDIDGHRAGAYCDQDGHLHIVDTTCPHMGCELNWNTSEKSWDCPCHGSRFDMNGKVIEGPALRDLNSGKSVNTIEKLAKDEF